MERELARLAEEACDDVALSEMEDGEEYAATLVDIAHAAAAAGGVLNWRVISMAKESNVIRRVNRILNRRLQVPKPFGRLAWVTLFACSLPVIYLSAAVKLASANRGSTVLKHAELPARPAEEARQPLLPEQKSSMSLIAQAAPNQPVRPAPPVTQSRGEDPPIAICILIDNSGSMRDKRAGVKAAALALVKASKPHDEVCIVDFNDEAFIDLPHGEDFTSDIKKMEEALTHIDSRGGTAMRDAMQMSIDHVEQTAHNDRKVLVLVTEGNDTSSTVTQEQLLGKVKNSRVLVYCIGLLNEDDPGQAGAARLALGQLAEASGGLVYYPKDLAEVESISPEIANKVRKQ
jgi:Mg-chelatase subunit ChlD